MQISQITDTLESFAPIALQESFDNCGLLVGNPQCEATGVLLCIDVVENIVDEAIASGCNLIVAHHPLIFRGIKKLNGKTYIERCIEKAVKNDVAIYAAHTNFDITRRGVSHRMAKLLNLHNIRILSPKKDILCKVVTFIPYDYLEKLKVAVTQVGAGHIGNYDSCSFSSSGEGSFRALDGAQPFVGEAFTLHTEQESRVEWILPTYILDNVLNTIKSTHPYEEPAIDVYPLANKWDNYGLGVVGELTEERTAGQRHFRGQSHKAFAPFEQKNKNSGAMRRLGSRFYSRRKTQWSRHLSYRRYNISSFFRSRKQYCYCRYRTLRERTVYERNFL